MAKRAGSDWFKFYHADFWGPGVVPGLSNDAALAFVFLLGVQAEHGHIALEGQDPSTQLPARFKDPVAVWRELEPYFPLVPRDSTGTGPGQVRRNPHQARRISEIDTSREKARAKKERQRFARMAKKAVFVPGDRPGTSAGTDPGQDRSGSPSLSRSLSLVPSGSEQTHARAKNGWVPIPATLNVPEFRTALEAFESGKPKGRHKIHGLRLLLRDLEPYGPDVAVRAIEQAIKGAWQSIEPTRLPEFQRNGHNGHDPNEPKGFQAIRNRMAGKPTLIDALLPLITPAKVPQGAR